MRQVILGHRGMVGSALHRLIPRAIAEQCTGDLRDALRVRGIADIWLRNTDVLYLCAARVGGIQRNISEPGQMLYDNLMIQMNVIEGARMAGVKLIVFLGSSCIYPVNREGWPINEDCLMEGPLEPTNEPYAIAKIAGIKLLEAYCDQYGLEYLAVMPCNLYGPKDNFDPETSHFLPGMMRRFHEAKITGADSVMLWGTGTPRRELMHVDDCARIIVELIQAGARGLINIGWGKDKPIAQFASRVAETVGYCGEITWDHSRPDGIARKLLDVTRMKSFGIEPKVTLRDGFNTTYKWFLDNVASKAVGA